MFFSPAFVRASWVVNLTALLGTLGWILCDGKFRNAALQFIRHVRALGNEESALAVVTPLMWPRVDALWLIIVVGLLSAAGVFAGLVAGSGRHRNVRSWLAVMILLAGWLTLFTTWPEIAWRGQVWRLRGAVDQFDRIAETLLAEWPTGDGKIEGLGPFMAYPIGNPRTLMFVATPRVPDTNVTISTVERGGEDNLHFELADDGSVIARQGNNNLHFQLGGNDEGAWLVRQEGDSEPHSFFSGLEGEYMPIKYSMVKPGWYLVRYVFAPILPDAEPEINIPRR